MKATITYIPSSYQLHLVLQYRVHSLQLWHLVYFIRRICKMDNMKGTEKVKSFITLLHNTTNDRANVWLTVFLSCFLKHIISKRNEPLPWHKILIKITSVLLNGHVCNSFILFLFQISTLFMLINFLSIRNERVFRIKNVKTIFSSFYSDWLNLLLKNL